MKYILHLLLLLFFSSPLLAKTIHITLVQANDVYEIAPLSGGEYGGLARVSTQVNDLKKKNPNTYTILAGDFINPSALGTAKVNGERLNGKQMVDILNRMSWDYALLGNHEFDKGRATLTARLSEAQFKIINSNIFDTATQTLFKNTQAYDVINIDGIKLGFAGVTLPTPSADFVTIEDPQIAAKQAIIHLKQQEQVDILVLLTHQNIHDDIALANNLNHVDLILGGHEHENIYLQRGENLTPIAKADANARSIYIHHLYFDTHSKKLTIDSTLQAIDHTIKQDTKIKAAVNQWQALAFKSFEGRGLNPTRLVVTNRDALDGLEASVRNQTTTLTEIISDSALHAFDKAQASLFNAGSIRIDDILPPGPISEYDVIRILPFGGNYELVTIPGDLLQQALDVGLKNKGSGGFLHGSQIQRQQNSWLIAGKKIDAKRSYAIAITQFLIEKGDAGLEFLVNNPRISKLSDKHIDVQQALIAELKHRYQ